MPSGEGTDDEVLAREERECVGGPDVGPELQVGRRQGLGLDEFSGHHRVERIVEPGDPSESRLTHRSSSGADAGQAVGGHGSVP